MPQLTQPEVWEEDNARDVRNMGRSGDTETVKETTGSWQVIIKNEPQDLGLTNKMREGTADRETKSWETGQSRLSLKRTTSFLAAESWVSHLITLFSHLKQ